MYISNSEGEEEAVKPEEGEPATRGDRLKKKVILVHVESLSRIRASSTTGLSIVNV